MNRIAVMTVICVFATVPANGDLLTVNIDFQAPHGTVDGGGVATTYSGLGKASDSGTFWNQVGTVDVFNLTASDGFTPTEVDVSSDYVRTYANTGNDLLRDRLITSPSGRYGQSVLNISGLDAALQYNVYLYGGYYGQTYTINGNSQTLTGLDWNDDESAWSYGTQYVAFMGLTPAGGLIDIAIFSDPFNSTQYGEWTAISGMQIQAVPVPGAFLLGMLGLGIAGARLRKKRA